MMHVRKREKGAERREVCQQSRLQVRAITA